MKIIHVITAFGIGGAERLLLNTINRQVEKHEVHLIYLKSVNDLIHLVDKRVVIKQIPLTIFTIKKLRSYFKSYKPEVIHTHLGHADILGIWAAKKSNAKIFCTMHNIYFKQSFIDTIFFKIYKYLFKKRKRNVKVISISKSVESHVINTLKLPKDRSFLLYNAIPSKEFDSRKMNDSINVLLVGRLEKQKSIDTLIRSVESLKDKNITVKIVGDGSLKTELISLTEKLKVNHLVKFVGKQENTDTYYQNADIFVLPSIWEGFGIVILEAFRAKVAVVASNIEGPAELILHQENGLLFEPKNHINLAEQLKTLIENPKLRQKLSENGYKTFTKEFQIENYVKKLEEIYSNA